jgi:hypothetical protein
MRRGFLNVSATDYTAACVAGILNSFHLVIAFTTHLVGSRQAMKDTLNVLLSRLRMKQLQLLIALDDHTSLHKAAGAMSMTQSAYRSGSRCSRRRSSSARRAA